MSMMSFTFISKFNIERTTENVISLEISFSDGKYIVKRILLRLEILPKIIQC